MSLVTYTLGDAGGVRWAFDTKLEPGASADDAAAELLARLPGHRVETADDTLVSALVARGGRVQRRAHDYAYDLAAGVPGGYSSPALPPGATLAPVGALDGTALGELADAHDLAYPLGHPDHEPGLDHRRELTGMLAGRILGPLVPAASWRADVDGRPAGAVLVVDRPAFGPVSARLWVLDVFVHPRLHGQGLGAALLRRSLAGAAAAGHACMGLVVSDGNPARWLYERAGFTLVASGTNVDLPRGG